MATPNILKAVNSCQALEQTVKQLTDKDVKNLLNEWFEELKNPSRPGGSEKGLKIMGDQNNYFDLLEEALEEICASKPKPYPPPPSPPYIEQLCSQNNPYDFAKTLEQAVEATLHFEDKINPKTTFLLYYSHHRHLKDTASKKLFSATANKQIGRIWA